MNTEIENKFLVITASGADRLGLVEQLAGRIADCGCNIEESSMTVMGGQLSFIARVTGAWHALSKLEGQASALGAQLGLAIALRRTGKSDRSAIPYTVELVAMDQPGIVRKLAAFFTRNGISIDELRTSSYFAPHTGSPLTSVIMTVGIHAKIHIPTLREDFLDYCDELNLDATLEPMRG
ncbi:MAG: glycine cleavage system protein R [Gallionellaceae bacterium]|nr:MAG: glycine cleavage system protein R [Gallionellaceae bacterium]